MRLVVVRHAIAEDREGFARSHKDDAARPLTPDGRRKMARAALGLKELVPELELLAASPYKRALETAEIIAHAYGHPRVERVPELAPGAGVDRALLDDARVACGRLAALDDVEALHDFRVALRRVRSALRSFRSELGDAVPKKLQRRLRDVTRATGAARDAEVQLGWVRSHRAELGRRLAPGLPWLLARLRPQQDP